MQKISGADPSAGAEDTGGVNSKKSLNVPPPIATNPEEDEEEVKVEEEEDDYYKTDEF